MSVHLSRETGDRCVRVNRVDVDDVARRRRRRMLLLVGYVRSSKSRSRSRQESVKPARVRDRFDVSKILTAVPTGCTYAPPLNENRVTLEIFFSTVFINVIILPSDRRTNQSIPKICGTRCCEAGIDLSDGFKLMARIRVAMFQHP